MLWLLYILLKNLLRDPLKNKKKKKNYSGSGQSFLIWLLLKQLKHFPSLMSSKIKFITSVTRVATEIVSIISIVPVVSSEAVTSASRVSVIFKSVVSSIEASAPASKSISEKLKRLKYLTDYFF